MSSFEAIRFHYKSLSVGKKKPSAERLVMALPSNVSHIDVAKGLRKLGYALHDIGHALKSAEHDHLRIAEACKAAKYNHKQVAQTLNRLGYSTENLLDAVDFAGWGAHQKAEALRFAGAKPVSILRALTIHGLRSVDLFHAFKSARFDVVDAAAAFNESIRVENKTKDVVVFVPRSQLPESEISPNEAKRRGLSAFSENELRSLRPVELSSFLSQAGYSTNQIALGLRHVGTTTRDAFDALRITARLDPTELKVALNHAKFPAREIQEQMQRSRIQD